MPPEIGKSALLAVPLEPFAWTWDPSDVMLYALGVGADPQADLPLVYEGLEGPEILSTFVSVPTSKTFLSTVRQLGVELESVLHAEQDVTILSPIPASGQILVRRSVTDVWDKGSGALVVIEEADTSAEPIFLSRASWWIKGAGRFGGERGPSRIHALPAESEPDLFTQQVVASNQAALYRLSGDLNPIHVDPAFARAAGYQRPFIHGLATYGLVELLLSRAIREGERRRLTRLAARFTAPVYPGDRLTLEAWRTVTRGFQLRASVGSTVVLEGHAETGD